MHLDLIHGSLNSRESVLNGISTGSAFFTHTNKTVIDRTLFSFCCQLQHKERYFKCQISSPVRPLACNWYYCAHFIAKPKAVCALRFTWAATSINLGLWANMTSSIKPEVHNISLRHQRRTEPRPLITHRKKLVKIGRVILKIWSRTNTHTETRSSQYSTELQTDTHTKTDHGTLGHTYKPYKRHSCCSTRSSFFFLNGLLMYGTIFQLTPTFSFKRQINRIDCLKSCC